MLEQAFMGGFFLTRLQLVALGQIVVAVTLLSSQPGCYSTISLFWALTLSYVDTNTKGRWDGSNQHGFAGWSM